MCHTNVTLCYEIRQESLNCNGGEHIQIVKFNLILHLQPFVNNILKYQLKSKHDVLYIQQKIQFLKIKQNLVNSQHSVKKKKYFQKISSDRICPMMTTEDFVVEKHSNDIYSIHFMQHFMHGLWIHSIEVHLYWPASIIIG